jgi:hypothetical protein
MEEQKVLEEAATFRKNNPRSNADFAVLYNDLEVWRAKEMETIKVSRVSFKFFYDFILACTSCFLNFML